MFWFSLFSSNAHLFQVSSRSSQTQLSTSFYAVCQFVNVITNRTRRAKKEENIVIMEIISENIFDIRLTKRSWNRIIVEEVIWRENVNLVIWRNSSLLHFRNSVRRSFFIIQSFDWIKSLGSKWISTVISWLHSISRIFRLSWQFWLVLPLMPVGLLSANIDLSLLPKLFLEIRINQIKCH